MCPTNSARGVADARRNSCDVAPRQTNVQDSSYCLTGSRGLLIKTLFQTESRVSDFVAVEIGAPFFEDQMILIRKGNGSKQRYVPILSERAQELQTHLQGRAQGYLFETNRHAAFSPRRIQQRVKETANLTGIAKWFSPHLLRHFVATTSSGTWHGIGADSDVPRTRQD